MSSTTSNSDSLSSNNGTHTVSEAMEVSANEEKVGNAASSSNANEWPVEKWHDGLSSIDYYIVRNELVAEMKNLFSQHDRCTSDIMMARENWNALIFKCVAAGVRSHLQYPGDIEGAIQIVCNRLSSHVLYYSLVRNKVFGKQFMLDIIRIPREIFAASGVYVEILMDFGAKYNKKLWRHL